MNNHIVIAGHLGADPEVRFSSSGQKITTFRLASNTKRGGNPETIWWRVTVFGEHMDKLISYLKKGSAVIVMGELQKPEIFNDREGKPQVSLNVIAANISFSPFGKSDKNAGDSPYGAARQPAMAQNPAMSGSAPQDSSYGAAQDPFSHSQGYDPMMRGQGGELPDFNDEEIPF
ncbi:MAG: single-stranded DNA-binding protein [Simkaniaceae bacterium]